MNAAIIFDSFNGNTARSGLTSKNEGDFLELHVDHDIAINQISVLTRMLAPGDATFAIYSVPDGSLLLKTLPIHLAVDGTAMTWKTSPTFTFTLLAGHNYAIGSRMSADRMEPNLDFVSETMNGITSNLWTWAVGAASDSDTISRFTGGEISIRLITVPEPSTLSLVAISVIGLFAVRRRHSAR